MHFCFQERYLNKKKTRHDQAKDIVKFIPIQLVKAEQDGVWLTGLGSEVDIITVGQGFVRDGDSVISTRQ